MAILAKCNEALQVLQFMAHDGCTVYAVGAVMYLQIVRFSAHAASVSVADADFALYFFPIGIMLQALPISARPALDVCCSCHSIPPFCVCFFSDSMECRFLTTSGNGTGLVFIFASDLLAFFAGVPGRDGGQFISQFLERLAVRFARVEQVVAFVFGDFLYRRQAEVPVHP